MSFKSSQLSIKFVMLKLSLLKYFFFSITAATRKLLQWQQYTLWNFLFLPTPVLLTSIINFFLLYPSFSYKAFLTSSGGKYLHTKADNFSLTTFFVSNCEKCFNYFWIIIVVLISIQSNLCQTPLFHVTCFHYCNL